MPIWAPLSRKLGIWLLFCIAGCSLFTPNFQKPMVTVVGVELVGGNLLQQNFLLKLNIDNPNDRALPVISLHADLNVLGDRVASGDNTRSFVVPARGNMQFDITIKANVALVLLKLAGRGDRRSDPIDYEVTGGARLDLPLLRELPFHQHGSFTITR